MTLPIKKTINSELDNWTSTSFKSWANIKDVKEKVKMFEVKRMNDMMQVCLSFS